MTTSVGHGTSLGLMSLLVMDQHSVRELGEIQTPIPRILILIPDPRIQLNSAVSIRVLSFEFDQSANFAALSIRLLGSTFFYLSLYIYARVAIAVPLSLTK